MCQHLFVTAALMAVSLTSCGPSQEGHSARIQRQVGRFAIIPAADGFPPLVVDTAAGCVMAVAKDQAGQITIDEVMFPDGTSSCRASKQLLVVDTASKSD